MQSPPTPCTFEPTYVSLYQHKESLEAQQSLLDSQLSSLHTQLQDQIQRKARLLSLQSDLETREADIRRETDTMVDRGKAILSEADCIEDLKIHCEAVRSEIAKKEEIIAVESRQFEEFQTETDRLLQLFTEKKRISEELSTKLREATQRISLLDSQRFDLQLDSQSVESAKIAVNEAISTTEREIKSLEIDLSAPASIDFPDKSPVVSQYETDIASEELKQTRLQASLTDAKSGLAVAISARSDSHRKKLELTQLLSKVQSSLLLHNRGTAENAAVLQKISDQMAIFDAKKTDLAARKVASEAKRLFLSHEMTAIETKFDALQMRISDCLRREKAVGEGKTRQWDALRELKAKKDEQTKEFQQLKEMKHELLIQEIKVEELRGAVGKLRTDIDKLKQVSEKCDDQSDFDSELQRLNLEDEHWQRQFRMEQQRMKEKAEALRQRETALIRKAAV